MPGIEQFIHPSLAAVAVFVVLATLLRGFHREQVELEGEPVRKLRYDGKQAGKALVIGVGAAAVLLSLVVVPHGHRGVVYSASGGVSPNERGEGWSLVVPVVQSATLVNVQTRKFADAEVYAQSADLQEISVPVSVNYHVDPGEAAELYRDIGKAYEDTVIRPAVLQIAKAEIGQVKAIDFAAGRQRLAERIRGQLTEQVGPYGIVVEHVNVEDAVFAPEFIAAVQAKVVANEVAEEQRRLVPAEEARKAQVILQAEAQEEQAVALGRGQAEAIEAVASALGFTPQQYIDWLATSRWDGQLPATLLGGDVPLSVLLTERERAEREVESAAEVTP